MQAPVFKTLNTPDIQALVGKAPARIYPFGTAKQGTAKPYIVFQTVAVTPYNVLPKAPTLDRHLVQIDVYADTAAVADRLAALVRSTLDQARHHNEITLQTFERDTGLYRYSFNATFINSRI